jgi:hypothetical protein
VAYEIGMAVLLAGSVVVSLWMVRIVTERFGNNLLLGIATFILTELVLIFIIVWLSQ